MYLPIRIDVEELMETMVCSIMAMGKSGPGKDFPSFVMNSVEDNSKSVSGGDTNIPPVTHNMLSSITKLAAPDLATDIWPINVTDDSVIA